MFPDSKQPLRPPSPTLKKVKEKHKRPMYKIKINEGLKHHTARTTIFQSRDYFYLQMGRLLELICHRCQYQQFQPANNMQS